MKKCLNCNETYNDDWYSCPKCGKVLEDDGSDDDSDDGSQIINTTKPFKISDERAVEIDKSAGNIGCWTAFACFILLILSIFSGGNALFIVLTLIDVAIIIICIAAQSAVKKHIAVIHAKKSAEYEEKKKKEQEEQQREIEKQKMVAFYDKCIKNGVRNLNSDTALQKASLIAETFGFHMAYAEYYNKGKALREQINKEEEIKHLLSLEEKEREQHLELTRYSSYIGREKTIKMLNDLMAPYIYQLSQLQAEKNKATNAYVKGPQLITEHDWAIQGGIASGLAGGAAGVATALNAQRENEKIREWNNKAEEINTQYVHATLKYAAYKKTEINQILGPLEAKLEKARIRLVENSDEQELLDMITFEDVKVKLSKTGAFTVNVSSFVRKPVTMFENTNAVIDGAVSMDFLQDGNIVGTVILVAPIDGFDDAFLKGICLANDNTMQKDKPYETKIKPYHLWKIEA